MQAPLICITEAKLHEGLERAIPQAAAQMIGAQVFNKKTKTRTACYLRSSYIGAHLVVFATNPTKFNSGYRYLLPR